MERGGPPGSVVSVMMSCMSYSIAQMRAMTDEQLIAEHDEHARNTVVATGYYLEELQRREQTRAIEASERLARVAVRLSWASAVLSGVAVVVAVIALLVGR